MNAGGAGGHGASAPPVEDHGKRRDTPGGARRTVCCGCPYFNGGFHPFGAEASLMSKVPRVSLVNTNSSVV